MGDKRVVQVLEEAYGLGRAFVDVHCDVKLDLLWKLGEKVYTL
jgi:hypothetical protein